MAATIQDAQFFVVCGRPANGMPVGHSKPFGMPPGTVKLAAGWIA